jgi:hypothetical protein
MTNSPLPNDVAEIARTARLFRRLVLSALVLVAIAAVTFGAIKLDQRQSERHESWVQCVQHPFSDPDAIRANLDDCDRLYK